MNPVGAASLISPAAQPATIGSAGSIGQTVGKSSGSGGDFGKLVGSFVKDTNQAQLSSDQAIDDLVRGKTDNVQQVVMAVANAEMSFKMFMEIRNKLIDSYNDLMRMQF